MTLNSILISMIYKNKISTLLTILILLLCPCITNAIQSGNIEYNAAAMLFDYTKLDPVPIIIEADKYFEIAFQQQIDKNLKERYLNLAMGKYILASKIQPQEIRNYVQLARIYDEFKKDSLAKSNFFHATNLELNDPYTNFWFGEFYYKRRDFKRALKHFTIAYNNGYANDYELNLRLATIYEKFADLINAKKYYSTAFSLNPQTTELQEKIQAIDNSNYEQSEYYHFIRE